MREALFIKQNQESWKDFEGHLHNKKQVDPDSLAKLFIKLTDDLSYAKTFYPGSKTTLYLNELTARAHSLIYKNKKERGNRFISFWITEVPQAAFDLRRHFLYSLIVFSVAMLLGALSMHYDRSFARLILGDGYVNMTLENIENGDPMGVYKSGPPFEMFARIAINNIKVALFAFAAGVIFSVVTCYILLYNGIMVGVFQYFFFLEGLGDVAALSIWIHGTLEISAIIIAGGAGLALGSSLIFPGTYTRLYSLKTKAVNGVKIIISLFPVFLTAAFLEGFVTRHTDMPLWLSLAIILFSLSFIVFYYIIYPQFISNRWQKQKALVFEKVENSGI